MDLKPCTLMAILAYNGGHPLVAVNKVAQDYYGLTAEAFLPLRKVRSGAINIALTEMEKDGRKCRKDVIVTDLANYLNDRAEEARELARKMAA